MKRAICFQITAAAGMHTFMAQKSSFREVKLPFGNLVAAAFSCRLVRGYQIACSCGLEADHFFFFFPRSLGQAVSLVETSAWHLSPS